MKLIFSSFNLFLRAQILAHSTVKHTKRSLNMIVGLLKNSIKMQNKIKLCECHDRFFHL